MPIVESRGNRGGKFAEVNHVSGGTATDNYVVTSTGDGKAAWEAGGGGGISDGDKGDITVSGSGATWTIDNTAVTYAKIQAVTASRLLGNDGSGTACEEIAVGSTELAFGTATLKLQKKKIFEAECATPPTTLGAARVNLVGGATPAEAYPGWAFDQAVDEYLDFPGELLASYAGRGVEVRLKWRAASTSNNCVWRAAFRRIADDAEDIDSTAHSYTYTSVTAAAPSAAGELSYDTITGIDMDGLSAGEAGILRVGRHASSGSDNMTGDAILCKVTVYEVD